MTSNQRTHLTWMIVCAVFLVMGTVQGVKGFWPLGNLVGMCWFGYRFTHDET